MRCRGLFVDVAAGSGSVDTAEGLWAAMETTSSDICSFVIKVWLEETVAEHGAALWRGHVTHVPSGTRRYVQTLEGVLEFVIPYLVDMGVEVEMQWWINTNRRAS